MLKRIIFSLLLVCTVVSISESQLERKRRDGLWWYALDEIKRMDYIVGYTKGIQIGAQSVLDTYVKGSKCYINGKLNVDSLLYYMTFIDINYMLFKIDSFYKDSTNLGLMLFHVYYLSLQEALETPEEYLRQIYYMFRREDCDQFQTFEELQNYKLSY